MNGGRGGRSADWGCMSVILFGIFSAVFGWQVALFWPPGEYQFAGWIVAGVCALATGLAAAR